MDRFFHRSRPLSTLPWTLLWLCFLGNLTGAREIQEGQPESSEQVSLGEDEQGDLISNSSTEGDDSFAEEFEGRATLLVTRSTSASGADFENIRSSDFPWTLTPTSGLLSLREGRFVTPYALGKLALVIGGVFFWLRYVGISSSSHISAGMSPQDRERVKSWTAWLFFAGLVGICISTMIPASTWAAGLLVASIVVPYGQFMRWQHQHLGEDTPKLSWLPSLPKSTDAKPTFEAIPFSHTGIPADTGKAQPVAANSIRLVGKSALRGSGSVLSQTVEDSPAFQYIMSMIGRAVNSSATDLHINSKPDHVEVRQRVNGTLEPLPGLPLKAGASVINILKVMSELSIADKRRSQDGSFLVDVDSRRLSFRVSSQGTQTGEKLSIRILDPATSFGSLADLGMPPEIVDRLEKQLHQRHGLILFVGATGAGKSTTACAVLQKIDTTARNVVSIEDPIEYQIPTIDQIEVNLRAGQTFESALRSVLRLDADVIFIGEIRDSETAKIALQAAQTGQLVLATMHATDSVGGFQRLADLTGDPTGVASTVRAVVAQTLVRKLCPSCRSEYAADETAADAVGAAANDALYRSSTEMSAVCPTCAGRRFLRRTGVYEMTEANSAIRDLVRRHAPLDEIVDAAREAGMLPLREQATELVRQGVISINELNRILGD